MSDSRTGTTRAPLRFAKYHGTGNDFVMIEDPGDDVTLDRALVAAVCDRHQGVGADGLIRVTIGDDSDFFMDYYNADGGVAEMCGNGVRCLAKLVFERGLTDKTELAIATRAGIKHVWLHVEGSMVESVTVDMGSPAFTRAQIPMEGPPQESFLAEPFDAGGMTVKASAVSMGNPHLVLFMDDDPRDVDVHRIGPALEHDPRFPERTNVEFVAAAENGLHVRVWERGVGETMACGTGACASHVAANLAGLAARRGSVTFPGGTLDIDWREDDRVYLTGAAERVFDGDLDRTWLEERGLA
jgi:diaminopimelate epimerase